jgi:hypothetical protein
MDFNGSWVLESSENFDNFMKELGLNFILRKVIEFFLMLNSIIKKKHIDRIKS